MRILVIANLPPYVLGGAENQVARLVEVWASLGHHVEVAGHRIPDGYLELGEAKIRTHRIEVTGRLGRGGRAASYFTSLARLFSSVGQNFDVIYSRGIGDGAISICLLKSLGRINLPLVACPINARGSGDAHFIQSIPGWRWIVKAINQHCEAINIIAPAIEHDLSKIGITRPRLSHIPNGIALAPPVTRNTISRVRRLVWTGRLSPQKGLDIFLPVLARAAATGLDFRLDIVGEGPDQTALRAQCQQLNLDDRVFFIGAVGPETIRHYLSAADVFVLPSRYEGMSNAALEAMEAGLPLLLTRCGGIDTYVDSGIGWVCEPDDKGSLFAALCSMLEAPDFKLLAMGQRARALVEQEFEIGNIGRRNVEIMVDMMSVKEGT